MGMILEARYGRPMEPSDIDDPPLKIGRASKFRRPTMDFQGEAVSFREVMGWFQRVFLKCLCILILGEMILE